MKNTSVTFFFDKGTHPYCHIDELDPEGFPGTITIKINDAGENAASVPQITLFIESEEDAIGFKNSVLWAFEKYMSKISRRRNLNEEPYPVAA